MSKKHKAKVSSPHSNSGRNTNTIASYPSKNKSNLIFKLIIVVLAFILYGGTLKYTYVMDDNIVTQANKFVQKGLSGIPDIIGKGSLVGFNGENTGTYRPASIVMLAIENHFFGNNPKISHFMNILIYAITCLVLFELLKLLFPLARHLYIFFIVLLFLTHPVHTEVAANIKSRDELLGFLFNSLSFLFILQYVREHKISKLIYGLLVFGLACFSKENAIMFALVIPMGVFFFTDTKLKTTLRILVPFLAMAGFYLLVRNSILDEIVITAKMDVINNSLAGAANSSERFATTFKILGKYIMLLLYPSTLSWDYSFNQIPISTPAEPFALLSILVYTGLFIFSILKVKSKNIFSFCFLYFILLMAPVSNIFVDIGSTMAERFLYSPSLAYCMVLGAGLSSITGNGFQLVMRHNKLIFQGTILTIVLLFSVKTYDRSKAWKDNLTLFLAGVEDSPNSARTHTSLAFEYTTQAQQATDEKTGNNFYSKAIEEFNIGLKIYPQFADGWYNLGYTNYLLVRYDEAYIAFQKTIEISPKYSKAYNNMGVIHFSKKEYDKALELFKKAVDLNPYYDEALGNIGAVYHNTGNSDEAVIWYNKALQVNPNLSNVQSNLNKIKK